MPTKYKNKRTERFFKGKGSFGNCRLCGKSISPDITKSLYCVDCNIRFAERIRADKKAQKLKLTELDVVLIKKMEEK